jgi:hypothetical protein
MTPQVPSVGGSLPKLGVDASSKTVGARGPPVADVKEARVWNTKNLGLRLAADFTAGFSAACIVAPVITIIDK